MTDRPIPNCYWVAPGKLLAGEYPGSRHAEVARAKTNALIHAGIAAFIDLTEDEEGVVPYSDLLGSVSYQRFPVRDTSIPRSRGQTVAILDAIDGHIGQGHLVYLHCRGGVGRTGVIVGCWLARHGFEGEAALAKLRELWSRCDKAASRRSPERVEQEQYVVGWKETP